MSVPGINNFKNIAAAIIYFSGIPFLIRELFQRNKTTIILYHNIEGGLFAKHINTLKKSYSAVSLQDYLRAEKDPAFKLPKKSLVISFDDGHANNYRLLPLIKEHNIPVTIFICSSIVNTNRHFWFLEENKNATLPELQKMPDDKRLEAMKSEGFEENMEFDNRQALNREEILEMSEYVDFQSHTKFHVILPSCSNLRAENEISGSKNELEQKLGLKINSISYPNGDYSERDIVIAKKAGYELGITVDNGFNKPGDDPFRLKRFCIDDNAGNYVLRLQACGLWAFIKNLFFKKGYGYSNAVQD